MYGQFDGTATVHLFKKDRKLYFRVTKKNRIGKPSGSHPATDREQALKNISWALPSEDRKKPRVIWEKFQHQLQPKVNSDNHTGHTFQKIHTGHPSAHQCKLRAKTSVLSVTLSASGGILSHIPADREDTTSHKSTLLP